MWKFVQLLGGPFDGELPVDGEVPDVLQLPLVEKDESIGAAEYVKAGDRFRYRRTVYDVPAEEGTEAVEQDQVTVVTLS